MLEKREILLPKQYFLQKHHFTYGEYYFISLMANITLP